MEEFFNAIGTGLGNSVTLLADYGVLFAVFAVIWIAFGYGLLRSQATVDRAWARIRALPMLVQLLVWLLFLPVMLGLWIWKTTWPLVVRVALLIGIAGWNLIVFLPRAFQAAP